MRSALGQLDVLSRRTIKGFGGEVIRHPSKYPEMIFEGLSCRKRLGGCHTARGNVRKLRNVCDMARKHVSALRNASPARKTCPDICKYIS